MHIQYLALLAAVALAASAHGLQVVSDSASPLQRTNEARQQPYIKDKTERFLTGGDKELPLLVTSTGYASRSLQEGDNGGHLRDNDYDYDSDLEPFDEERKAKHKTRSKRKGKSKSFFGFVKKSRKNDDEEEVDTFDETEAPTTEPSNDLTESIN